VIGSRDELERSAEALGEDVRRPVDWGGYLLVPASWEFWQHRLDRLHDRFRYRSEGADWVVERLAP
jgi:pyridoxamine 5'-phosphate oxidase